jgi:hypothetical protein
MTYTNTTGEAIAFTDIVQEDNIVFIEILVPGPLSTNSGTGDPGGGLEDHLAASNPHSQYARPFVYTQSSPAGQWTINHNFGYRPAVAVFDSGSQQLIADVVHLSVNTVQLTLNPSTAGFARLI